MWMIDKLTKASEALFRERNEDEFQALEGIPGPTPSMPLGNAGDFIGHNPWEVLRDYGQTYGDLVRFWIMGDPALLPLRPDLTEAVLLQGRDFPKKNPLRALLPLLTPVEAFLANEPEWAAIARRAPLGMPEVSTWIPTLAGPLRVACKHAVSDLGPGPHDAITAMRKISFDLFSVIALGKRLPEEAREAFHRMADEGDERMNAVLPLTEESWDPMFRRARTTFWESFQEAIAAARRHGTAPSGSMLNLAIQSGTTLKDDELAAALANLFFSGLFSTTSGWTTLLWKLGELPEVLAAVETEARALPESWGLAEARGAPNLERAIREALRWAPPVPVYLRNAATDHPVVLDGKTLPPDTMIMVSNFAVQRSERYWPDPDRFDPARWTPEVIAANPYGSGAFWPFGRGHRACSGGEIALAILAVGTAELLRQGTVRVTVEGDAKWSPYFACMSLQNGRWTFART